MKVAIARYARISFFEWDDRPMTELTYWYGLLNDLLKEEDALDRLSENHSR